MHSEILSNQGTQSSPNPVERPHSHWNEKNTWMNAIACNDETGWFKVCTYLQRFQVLKLF